VLGGEAIPVMEGRLLRAEEHRPRNDGKSFAKYLLTNYIVYYFKLPLDSQGRLGVLVCIERIIWQRIINMEQKQIFTRT